MTKYIDDISGFAVELLNFARQLTEQRKFDLLSIFKKHVIEFNRLNDFGRTIKEMKLLH